MEYKLNDIIINNIFYKLSINTIPYTFYSQTFNWINSISFNMLLSSNGFKWHKGHLNSIFFIFFWTINSLIHLLWKMWLQLSICTFDLESNSSKQIEHCELHFFVIVLYKTLLSPISFENWDILLLIITCFVFCLFFIRLHEAKMKK